jgi:hypothetical protein
MLVIAAGCFESQGEEEGHSKEARKESSGGKE